MTDVSLEQRIRNLAPASEKPDWEDVLRRAATRDPERSHRTKIVAVLALLAALAIPALALSGALDGLFGFSAQGTSLTTPPSATSMSALQKLHISADSVQLLATGEGKSLYAARSESGGVCVAIAAATAGAPSFTQMRCGNGGAESFPSAAVPVLLMSPVFSETDSPDGYLQQLAGFAADAVARVAVLGPSGVVVSAPTTNNTFIAAVPHEPVTELRAYDASGEVVWSLPLVHR